MDVEGSLNVRNANGPNGVSLEAIANGGRLRIRDGDGKSVAELSVALNVGVLAIGGTGFDGHIRINAATGKPAMILSGRDGDIVLNDENGEQAVRLSGPLGDVILSGADAAEDFEIREEDAGVSAGTVMVIDEGGRLRESTKAYDRRVAGVVSGAGDLRPGVVLGRTQGSQRHRPIALVGRVYCQVSAVMAPIEVGDLLTSSPIAGHAMKAEDADRAHGAVLGKALMSLPAGQGQLPILVALQ